MQQCSEYWKNLKLANANDFKTNCNVFTYVQVGLLCVPFSPAIRKKKCENFEEFTQPPTHTFLCPTYLFFEEFTQPL